MADVDFALAQVRDRDLVIESLREQLEEAEFWKQALIAAQERAVAAEAQYPVSFTDEDVERVALAIASADDHGYDTDEEGLEHYRPYYVAAARAALSAYLEPTTKGDT